MCGDVKELGKMLMLFTKDKPYSGFVVVVLQKYPISLPSAKLTWLYTVLTVRDVTNITMFTNCFNLFS